MRDGHAIVKEMARAMYEPERAGYERGLRAALESQKEFDGEQLCAGCGIRAIERLIEAGKEKGDG